MKKFVRIMSVLTAASLILTALAGCGGSNGGSSAKIKIGGIGPITGGAAIYGNAVKNAAEIAVEEINAKGDIQFEFMFEDDEHDAEKSVNAYNKLKDKGMQILMGTVTTTPCIAVSSEANADSIFELTPSASSTDVIGGQPDKDGNVTIQRKSNVFQMCFTDPNQGTASAQYIGENKLAEKVAVIYNSSDVYSTGIYNNFVTESANQPFEIVSAEAFTEDSKTDFSVQLQKAKDAGADMVFLPIYYTEASLILTQAAGMDYAPTFFGCDGLDGLLAVEGFDTSLAEGVMLLTPFAADADDEQTKAFVSAYEEKYGETPIQFAADAYDGMYIIKTAAEKAGITPDMDASAICDALKAAMTEITYDGLTGSGMTWSADGEPNKEPKAVVIKDGAYTAM